MFTNTTAKPGVIENDWYILAVFIKARNMGRHGKRRHPVVITIGTDVGHIVFGHLISQYMSPLASSKRVEMIFLSPSSTATSNALSPDVLHLVLGSAPDLRSS